MWLYVGGNGGKCDICLAEMMNLTIMTKAEHRGIQLEVRLDVFCSLFARLVIN